MVDIIYNLALLIYGLRVVFFIVGNIKESFHQKSRIVSDIPNNVSVIVPARNEEDKIEDCLLSILRNNYPKDSFEVIAVNDRSEDKTGEIMDKLAKQYSNLRVLHVEEKRTHKNLKGKAGALDAGINITNGDIIMMTDADCLVSENWIYTIASQYSNDTVYVPSFTTIRGNRIFDKIQDIEWFFLNSMARGAVALGHPLGNYGNNLSIRKDVYMKLGGYEKIKFSVTEDLALLQTVHRSGGKVHYVMDRDAEVRTQPCKDIKEYLKQHHRWGVGGMSLGWRAMIFVGSTGAQWLGVIAVALSGQWYWLAGILLFRAVADFFLILHSLIEYKKLNLTIWVIPAVIFLMLIEPLIPIMLLQKNVEWKGQTFKKS